MAAWTMYFKDASEVVGGLIILLILTAAVIYAIPPLRARTLRFFVKLYAHHMEEEEIDAMRQKFGLSKEQVGWDQLLGEKHKIAKGDANKLGSMAGDLRHRQL